MNKLYTPICEEFNYIGINSYFEYWKNNYKLEIIKLPPDRRYTSYFDIEYVVGKKPNKKFWLCPEDVMPASNTKDGNTIISMQHRYEWLKVPNIVGLSMWVRDWNGLNSIDLGVKKNNLSIFSGTIRGDKHTRNKWVNSTTIFSSRPARRFTRTNTLYPSLKDYYQALAYSKYGLCLRGDSAWGQRIHEVMGCGCVPIVTYGMDTDLYFNKMQEGVHYIFANDKEDMDNKIKNISDEQYNTLRNNALIYFNYNNSPEGMWENIEKIVGLDNLEGLIKETE